MNSELNLELNIENTRYRNVENYLNRSELELENIQSYFPLVEYVNNDIKIKKWNTIILNRRLVDIKSYKSKYGLIEDEHGHILTEHFHTKCTPILDPLTICQNEYKKKEYNTWLPCDYVKCKSTLDKVNNFFNSAYIDSLCSVYLSKLKEMNKTRHYGSIYGIYSGIIKDYEQDISDEYSMYNGERWFDKCLSDGKFKLKRDLINDKLNISDLEICNLDNYAEDLSELNLPMKYGDDDDENVLIHPEVPVQVVLMEKFDLTFEDILKDNINRVRIPTKYKFIRQIRKNLVIKKLRSFIFQICAGLCVANNYIKFVHNDLHIQNIMGKKTNEEYLYYKLDDKIYRVPTYGYVMNIIDFGRSTFEINGMSYIGDVFNTDGDADGQYNSEITPHPCFDLCRLSCSFIEDLDDVFWPTISDLREYDIGNLLYSWIYDDNENNLLELDFDGFELYIHIAKHCRIRTPYNSLKHECFNNYLMTEIDESNEYTDILFNV
tara:strand:+ start:5664 stop:7139 length:1476 start_codon:yes stop_codon:yes gene_type:complete